MDEFVKFFVENASATSAILSVVILLLTFLIKFPFKVLTKKIQNVEVREWVDRAIIAIPFALAFLARFLLEYGGVKMTEFDAVMAGGLSVVEYDLIKKLFKRNNEKPMLADDETEKTKGEIFDSLVKSIMPAEEKKEEEKPEEKEDKKLAKAKKVKK